MSELRMMLDPRQIQQRVDGEAEARRQRFLAARRLWQIVRDAERADRAKARLECELGGSD